MTLPAGFTTVRIFGQFLTSEGKPLQGFIEFRPAVETFGGDVIVPVTTSKVPLDTTGAFSVDLVTSTSDAQNPDGWTYKVTQLFRGGNYHSYNIIAPNDISEINIVDVPSTAPNAPVSQYATVGSVQDVADRLFHHHVQVSQANVWHIVHALGYNPNVTIIDSTEEVVQADIAYPSVTEVTVTFRLPESGRALLS